MPSRAALPRHRTATSTSRASLGRNPKSRCRAMTQHGGRPTGEHRGHPVTEPGDASVADRVHPAVETMKPTDLEAAIDRARSEPELVQLPPREHSVLPS